MDHKQVLQVHVTHHGHCSVLELDGSLDFVTVTTLSGHIDDVWERSVGPRLVLELSRLHFYDSTALGVLAHTQQRVQATTLGRLLFVGVPGGLRHLLERTGLLPRFELRDSIEQAVADLLSPA